jgi:hypothetical protein
LWLLGINQTCSHVIHIVSLFALPHGFRLEIARKTNKKKRTKNFSSCQKIILTEKSKRACAQARKKSDSRKILAELTEPARARIFSALRAGALPNSRAQKMEWTQNKLADWHKRRLVLSRINFG